MAVPNHPTRRAGTRRRTLAAVATALGVLGGVTATSAVSASVDGAATLAAPAIGEQLRSGRYVIDGTQHLTPAQHDALIDDTLGSPRATRWNVDGIFAGQTTPGIHVDFADPNTPNDVREVVNWAALQWENALNPGGPVVIEFQWRSFGPHYAGVLGAAGVNGYRQSALLGTDAFVPAPILNHHEGRDAFPTIAEAGMVLNADLYGVFGGWCARIDPGSCASNSTDLPTTVLHEFGHALGLVDSTIQLPGEAPKFASPPDLYDTHLRFREVDDLYTSIFDLGIANSSVGGSALYMQADGPLGLYNPAPYSAGSSIGHWDEFVHGDALMTPFATPGDRRWRTIESRLIEQLRTVGWGPLTDGRVSAPSFSTVCDDVVSNPVIGSRGGPFESVVQSDPAAARIWRLYGVLFRRQPDPVGFQYWLDQYRAGLTIDEMTDYFFQAEEVIALYSNNLRVEQYVSTLYRNALGRCEDESGHEYWSGLLHLGELSGGEVLNYFAESEEFGIRTGVTATNYGDGDVLG